MLKSAQIVLKKKAGKGRFPGEYSSWQDRLCIEHWIWETVVSLVQKKNYKTTYFVTINEILLAGQINANRIV